jgi:hypothetical protein
MWHVMPPFTSKVQACKELLEVTDTAAITNTRGAAHVSQAIANQKAAPF